MSIILTNPSGLLSSGKEISSSRRAFVCAQSFMSSIRPFHKHAYNTRPCLVLKKTRIENNNLMLVESNNKNRTLLHYPSCFQITVGRHGNEAVPLCIVMRSSLDCDTSLWHLRWMYNCMKSEFESTSQFCLITKPASLLVSKSVSDGVQNKRNKTQGRVVT